MIYTCTLNPAIDLFISTPELLADKVNRTNQSELIPNGKGVNVSFILKALGIESTALGFLAGYMGQFVKNGVEAKSIKTDFLFVKGETRVNVFAFDEKIKKEYKLVNGGPLVSKESQAKMLTQLGQLTSQDVLIVSGSNPPGVQDQFIEEIAKICLKQQAKLVLDISSPVVRRCAHYRPFCIKPNETELASWFGQEDLSTEELIKLAQQLVEEGVKNVLLTLGGDGGILVNRQQVIQVSAPKIKAINTSCAGDTVLGTYIGCLVQGYSEKDALIKSIAAGSSTAQVPGLTDFSDVPELEKQIDVLQEYNSLKNKMTVND